MPKRKTTPYSDKQETGVFKSKNFTAKPSSTPEYYVLHKQNGISFYLYGFDNYHRATEAWYTLVRNLQNERL